MTNEPGSHPGVPRQTITVGGTGRVVVPPDMADLRLGVMASAKTVRAARGDAATSMAAVLDSLRAAGIADRDVQTTMLSLQPAHDYSGSEPRLTGYTLTNSVAVTIRDLALVDSAIDGALEAGATSLDGVTFGVADRTDAEASARRTAVADAIARARVLADAAGVTVDGIESIAETEAPGPIPLFIGALKTARDEATPVQPGTTEISVSVSVVFRIG